eukprot:NODE_73_length_24441_cov_0.672952.p10 type:complete len:219 gc:universal NODE_73_length_24441_cov_0.672952:5895-6551(+)
MSTFQDSFKKDFESHFSCSTDVLLEKPLMVSMFVDRKYASSTWSPIHFMGFLPENEQFLVFCARLNDPNVIALKTGNYATLHLSLPFTSNWTFSGKLYNVSHPKTYTRFFPPSIFDEASKFFWHKKRLDAWLNTSNEFRALLMQTEYLETDSKKLEIYYEQLNNSAIELPHDEHATLLQNFCYLVMKATDIVCDSQDTMSKTSYHLSGENWDIVEADL